MSISGPNLGRTTPLTTGETLLRHIAAQSKRIDLLSRQLSSNRRIQSVGQDALGATGWMSHTAAIKRNEMHLANAESLKQSFNFADGQLGEAADIITRLKDIALRESNATADAQTRANSASEVNQLRSALLQIANASFAGLNIFGGRMTGGTVFEAMGQAVRYRGTDGSNNVGIGAGVSIEAALNARSIFGVRESVVSGRRDLNARATLSTTSPPGTVALSTALSSLNGGRGIDTAGPIVIEVTPDPLTGARQTFTVDISHAETLEDVVVALNNVRDTSGAQVFDAQLFDAASQGMPQGEQSRASGISLSVFAGGPLSGGVLQPGATIRIADATGHTTAGDLGLTTAAFTHSFASEDLSAFAPFTGPFNFDLQVNGQTLAISATPGAPNGLTELATALDAAIAGALTGANIDNVTVNVSADLPSGRLLFDVADSGSAGYVALEATNDDAADLRLQLGASTAGPNFSAGAVDFSDDEGLFSRDLNVAASESTSLVDIFGGLGLTLETDAAGVVRSPQGLRITNGELTALIDLKPILEKQNATLRDVFTAIERAGVEVDARLNADGTRIELVNKLSGSALKVEDVNGSLGAQLGIVTEMPGSRIADLNNGLGLGQTAGVDFTLTTGGNQTVSVDIADSKNLRDVASAINSAADNVNPAGPPATYFSAAAVRQRTFDSAPVADPTLAFSFSVSFNGGPPRTVNIPASGGRTMAQLAQDMQDAVNRAARQAGADSFDVTVNADLTNSFLQFDVQDSDGVARMAFTGADAGTLDLDGSMTGPDGNAVLRNEQLSDRLLITDNTFDPLTYVPGGNQPLIDQSAGASLINDLGLFGSFDTATGRFVSADVATRGIGSDGLFGTLADLTLALQGNDIGAITRTISALQTGLNSVLDGRAEAGSRVQRLELTQNRLAVENENLSSLASEIMDTDLAAAAQEFQQAQTILQAGLLAAARIAQVSVLDYL
ncbi:MAG: hypothetical protein IT462_09250 [Planctomycetes bacterium]|nr:hypothetical protein [Planctomycetota bacterium]